MHLKNKLGLAVFAIMLALMLQLAVALPDGGGTVTPGTPEGKDIFFTGIVSALGGNNTTLNITGETQTISWQGFFGEVGGNLTLRDNLFNQLYSWELGTEAGEVYTSRDSAVDFSSIAAQNDCTIDEDLTGTDSDRVNETFTVSSNSEIVVGTLTIAANSACSTNTFVNSISQSSTFEETILTDDGGTTSIYTTIIENDATGFDGNTHDFQLIVPENSTNATSTYFFYLELE